MLNSPNPVHLPLIVILSLGSSQGLSALTSQCTDRTELTKCTTYVTGFLEGTLLPDSAILAAPESVETEHASFFLGAYRTRPGIKPDSIVPSNFLARFCLPAATDIDELAGLLAEKLSNNPASVAADQQLYAHLQADYPCAKPQEASR